VLVNDFGAINIDAARVAASGADAIALTNGCVCCSIGDDLTAALIKVLDMQPPVDAVVIEASGVSDPWRIAQIGLADPDLGLDGVIVLVDAGAVLEQSRDPRLADSLQRQLHAADLVVINKTDLATGDGLRLVREWVARVAGPVTMFETTRAVVPAAMVTGAALEAAQEEHADDRPRCCQEDHHHGHDGADHAALFDTWSQRPAGVLSAHALRASLRHMPFGVLRLKGVVRTDEYAWAEVQFAGRHGSLRRISTIPSDGPAVVAIGLRGTLPLQALDALFSPAASA
jgi:G3E family GTPase